MIKNLIVSYFNIVKKNINDSVPKTIVSFLVNRVKAFILLSLYFNIIVIQTQSVNIAERELVSSLYKTEMFDELLSENSFIMK